MIKRLSTWESQDCWNAGPFAGIKFKIQIKMPNCFRCDEIIKKWIISNLQVIWFLHLLHFSDWSAVWKFDSLLKTDSKCKTAGFNCNVQSLQWPLWGSQCEHIAKRSSADRLISGHLRESRPERQSCKFKLRILQRAFQWKVFQELLTKNFSLEELARKMTSRRPFSRLAKSKAISKLHES